MNTNKFASVVFSALVAVTAFAAAAPTAHAAEMVSVTGTLCTTDSTDIAYPLDALRALNAELASRRVVRIETALGQVRVNATRLEAAGRERMRTLASGRPQACVAVVANVPAASALAKALLQK